MSHLVPQPLSKGMFQEAYETSQGISQETDKTKKRPPFGLTPGLSKSTAIFETLPKIDIIEPYGYGVWFMYEQDLRGVGVSLGWGQIYTQHAVLAALTIPSNQTMFISMFHYAGLDENSPDIAVKGYRRSLSDIVEGTTLAITNKRIISSRNPSIYLRRGIRGTLSVPKFGEEAKVRLEIVPDNIMLKRLSDLLSKLS